MANQGCALVLPGAVTKGAYEAGAVSILIEKEVHIDYLIASSSGSLNAIVLAAGMRAGRPKQAVQELIQAWIDHGGWSDALHLNPLDWFRGKGLSDPQGLIRLLKEIVKPCVNPVCPVDLRIVVAPLNGLEGNIGGVPATTFEGIIHFTGEDFDTQEGLDRIFQAATAACAFPGLFAPVDIPGLGPCIDGSAVNNTPIRYAIDTPNVTRVIVPLPVPPLYGPRKDLRGFSSLEHTLEALVNERLYRDLRNVRERNRKIAEMDALVAAGGLTCEQRLKITEILNWRTVEVIEIRPPKTLDGTLFSGFLHKDTREYFVDQGRKSAESIAPSL